MLQLGELKAGEKMYDLGSGDGRIVIMAARKYKADATGVELDDTLYKQSALRIKTLGLESRARIVHGDLLQQDYSSYDLLTIYLLPVAIQKSNSDFRETTQEGRAHCGARLRISPVDRGQGHGYRRRRRRPQPSPLPLPAVTS